MHALIEINLSEEFERRRRKSMPRKQVPAALGAAIAITIASLAVFYIFVTIQAGRMGRTKSQRNAITKTVQDANTYQTEYDSLRARAQALDTWNAARVAWAPRWLHIANVTPEFVYLTEVLITPVDVNANTQRLVLRGRAFGTAGEDDVLRLVNNCKHATLLTNYFTSVTLASVASEGAEKSFTVELQRSATTP